MRANHPARRVGSRIEHYFCVRHRRTVQRQGPCDRDRVGLIAASGLTFLYVSGALGLDLLQHPYGWIIAAKTFFFLLLVVNGLIITFGIRPRIKVLLPLKTTEEELKAKQADMISASSTLNRLIRLNFIIASLAVILGVTLTFGGF